MFARRVAVRFDEDARVAALCLGPRRVHQAPTLRCATGSALVNGPYFHPGLRSFTSSYAALEFVNKLFGTDDFVNKLGVFATCDLGKCPTL